MTEAKQFTSHVNTIKTTDWYEIRIHEVQEPVHGILPDGCYMPHAEIIVKGEFTLSPKMHIQMVGHIPDSYYTLHSQGKSLDIKAGDPVMISRFHQDGSKEALYLIGPKGNLVNLKQEDNIGKSLFTS